MSGEGEVSEEGEWGVVRQKDRRLGEMRGGGKR